MAKDLIFKLTDKEYAGVPVKHELKKIYRCAEAVATDRDGPECGVGYLTPYDALFIPVGGFSPGSVDSGGS